MTTAAESVDRSAPESEPLPDFRAMSIYEFNCWIVEELCRQQALLRDLHQRIDGLAARWREAEGDGR